jgi:hypothetical protein
MLFMDLVNNSSAIDPKMFLRKSRDGLRLARSSERELLPSNPTAGRVSFDTCSDEVPQMLLSHFELAETRSGRFATETYFLWQRMRMSIQTSAPGIMKRAMDRSVSFLLLVLRSPPVRAD